MFAIGQIGIYGVKGLRYKTLLLICWIKLCALYVLRRGGGGSRQTCMRIGRLYVGRWMGKWVDY